LLDLSRNKFSGPIRDAFSFFESLDFIDLAFNDFTGVIPQTLFDIPTLRLAYLHNAAFEGNIPSNYDRPNGLRDLYLQSNRLTGTIPDVSEGQLQNMTEFLVQDNDLEGEMPASVCALRAGAQLEDLWSDCDDSAGDAEVDCSCCTQCTFDEEIEVAFGNEGLRA